ncbi:MAG TPA: Stp1/IreP family PP2C-type Ser/Thr phosphatase [Candidatus Tetragenococcus pullicola]|nr:Stp1/IreP family PP2C-type Ser/Thr phosphatase [Candidatus Tetragenococcus pullicola]
MEFSFRSDIGKRRTTNQDYAEAFTNQNGYHLALLADGMGGHRAGDVASQKVVTELGKKWQSSQITESEKAVQWLIQRIQEENTAIYEAGQQQEKLQGMGTTVEAVAILENQIAVGHVGDSRIYLLRDGQLMQLTEDHSLVNELVKSGELTKEMAAVHPQKNIVTRSVGMPGNVDVDVAVYDIHAYDRLLICSDGLTNMVSEEEIGHLINSSSSLEDACQRLIDKANAYGGLDNITVFLISFGGVGHD